ncbi:invasion associated locus B family protein [Acuticoccus sp. M5D2P5]|uniref:invasion associated locus B family protein n=1 Tax=Acuticoccus kalidii TaxID=2910977 RepID=UPI001F2CA3C8|nr:invasion associated locus B family protein [Acuticoccus kalidii]MCF3936272.1 invasion associated locus B family protein [Acuticoccus kalidii]
MTIPRTASPSARSRCTALVMGLVAAALPLSSVAAQDAGPDALTEVYRDWTVRCATPDGGERRCWMTQVVNQTETGERILQIEIALSDDGPLLAFLTPFGLHLPSGLDIAIDEGTVRTLAFRTCLPRGCLIEERPDEEELSAMRRGQTMSVTMVAAQNENAVNMELSLSGFSAAYNRLSALRQS